MPKPEVEIEEYLDAVLSGRITSLYGDCDICGKPAYPICLSCGHNLCIDCQDTPIKVTTPVDGWCVHKKKA